MTDEQRLKLATELTIQRRIQEHARDRAKRELAHATAELKRIDADFMRYVVEGLTDQLTASGMEAPSGGETENTGSTEGDSPTLEEGDAQHD